MKNKNRRHDDHLPPTWLELAFALGLSTFCVIVAFLYFN